MSAEAKLPILRFVALLSLRLLLATAVLCVVMSGIRTVKSLETLAFF